MKYDWVDTLEVGKYIYFKSEEEMVNEYGSLDNVRFTVNRDMLAYCGKRWLINKEILDSLKKKDRNVQIPLNTTWSISIEMLKPAKYCKIKNEVTVQDKSIMEEMISKVDFELLKKLFKIGTHKKDAVISDEIVKEYLERWASSKYLFYLAMGRELSVKKEVLSQISFAEMSELISCLKKQFPLYGLHMSLFETSEFVANTVNHVPQYYKEVDVKLCSNGMKLSKFLSKFFNDDKFDIELSKVLQNKMVAGTVELSINPIDYLTTSITKHKWNSCYDISDGTYSNGAFSIMCDEITLVAFKHSGKEFSYNLRGTEFDWNSKQSRSHVFFDLENKGFSIGRAQGSPNDTFYDTVKELCSPILKSVCMDDSLNPKSISTCIYAEDMGYYSHMRHDISNYNYSCSQSLRYEIGVKKIKNPINGNDVRESDEM